MTPGARKAAVGQLRTFMIALDEIEEALAPPESVS
jgi:hypothetical protein